MRIIEIIDKGKNNEHLAYAANKEEAELTINTYNAKGWPGDKTPVCPSPVITYLYGLKDIRNYRGLSQNTLSHLSGVNIRTLQDYEQEKRSLLSASAGTVLKLAHALNVHMEDLVMDQSMLFPYQEKPHDDVIDSVKAEYLQRFIADYNKHAEINLSRRLPEYALAMRNDLLLDEWDIMEVCSSLVSVIATDTHRIDTLKGGNL